MVSAHGPGQLHTTFCSDSRGRWCIGYAADAAGAYSLAVTGAGADSASVPGSPFQLTVRPLQADAAATAAELVLPSAGGTMAAGEAVTVRLRYRDRFGNAASAPEEVRLVPGPANRGL